MIKNARNLIIAVIVLSGIGFLSSILGNAPVNSYALSAAAALSEYTYQPASSAVMPSPWKNACSVSNSLSDDSRAAGLGFSTGDATVQVAGSSVTSCIDLDFGSVRTAAPIKVSYAMPSSVCSASCSGSYCGTNPGAFVFTSSNKSTWSLASTLSFSTSRKTSYIETAATYRYVRVCRGGGGGARNHLAVYFVGSGQPPASQPPTQGCTFSGQPVANGASVTAYQSTSVPAGSVCASESRTCSNGVLSGSYVHATCQVESATPPPDTTPPTSPTPGALQVFHTNTGNLGEKISSLPVVKSGPYKKYVVYSQRLENLKAGDILWVNGEFEATNDLGYNVMLASYLTLASAPTIVDGTEISEANGYNITPAMHHGMAYELGSYVITADTPVAYVNLVAYAASTAAGSGAKLTIEQDYGRLSILRFRNQ